MDIGIRLHDTVNGTLEERLRYVREQGFSCAHLALSKTVAGFDMDDAPERLRDKDFAKEVRSAFLNTGMRCAVLGCYLNLADANEERRKRTQEIYYAHLKFAKAIGAEVTGTETYANPELPYAKRAAESEEAFELFLESLRPVVQRAEEEDTVLAVEPVWAHVISTPERAQRMLEAIPSDHLRIILDAVNLIGPQTAARADEIVADAIARLGDKVSVLHMKDYRLENGAMPAMACGLGNMKYERLIRFAKEKDLPMTLENTVPENAETARLYLEAVGKKLDRAEMNRDGD